MRVNGKCETGRATRTAYFYCHEDFQLVLHYDLDVLKPIDILYMEYRIRFNRQQRTLSSQSLIS